MEGPEDKILHIKNRLEIVNWAASECLKLSGQKGFNGIMTQYEFWLERRQELLAEFFEAGKEAMES